MVFRNALDYLRNCKKFKFALLAGILGGFLAVLVDIDHFPAVWGGQATRNLHAPVLIGAGIVFFACLACLGRLYLRLVLNKK